MLDKLIELGIRDIDIKNMLEFIQEDNVEDFKKNINLLENIGCDYKTIRNIVVGNPFFLQKSFEDVYELVSYLNELGFTCLNLLFDSYPMFLNKLAFEIKDYIDKRIQNNEELEDIIDDIDSNPMIIDEI